jgi:hypothetical protein
MATISNGWPHFTIITVANGWLIVHRGADHEQNERMRNAVVAETPERLGQLVREWAKEQRSAAREGR